MWTVFELVFVAWASRLTAADVYIVHFLLLLSWSDQATGALHRDIAAQTSFRPPWFNLLLLSSLNHEALFFHQLLFPNPSTEWKMKTARWNLLAGSWLGLVDLSVWHWSSWLSCNLVRALRRPSGSRGLTAISVLKSAKSVCWFSHRRISTSEPSWNRISSGPDSIITLQQS